MSSRRVAEGGSHIGAGIPVRATATWVLLMIATGITWWLGASHDAKATSGRLLVAMAIPVAFLKVYLIGLEFMEVRTAPLALRVAFGAWATCMAIALTALYLI
jgi:hypothetical protein